MMPGMPMMPMIPNMTGKDDQNDADASYDAGAVDVLDADAASHDGAATATTAAGKRGADVAPDLLQSNHQYNSKNDASAQP